MQYNKYEAWKLMPMYPKSTTISFNKSLAINTLFPTKGVVLPQSNELDAFSL